jgi:hypothetical protein
MIKFSVLYCEVQQFFPPEKEAITKAIREAEQRI